MSFCSKCGTQFEGSFCPACGTAAANPAQPYVQPQPAPYGYVKPAIPGRGLGISGMVLGIIGLVYGVYIFMFSAFLSDIGLELESFTGTIVIFSILSILAVSLAAAGRNKGYRCGVSTSGVVMGVIGLALYLISFIIAAAS